MKNVHPALYELLKTFASGRVTIARAPQNQTTPFVVFQEVASERWRTINDRTGMCQDTFQIDVYGSTMNEAKELALSIENSLDGYRGTVYYGSDSPQDFVRIAGISRQDGGSTIDQTDEPFLYRAYADYLVTYEGA